LSFGASGLTGSISTVVSVTTPPPPPVGASEPVYNAGTQKLLMSDDFDGYATVADATAHGWTLGSHLTTPDISTNPAGANQLVAPGYDGTGKAIRLVYDGIANGAGQESHGWNWDHVGDVLAG